MLQSNWLDYGTWTIYIIPYRRSGPSIGLLINRMFGEKVTQKLSTEDREKLVTFGKLWVNFRKTFRENLKR